MVRYKRLFSAKDLRLTRQGEVWSVDVVWRVMEQPPPLLLTDSTFAYVVELGQRGTGRMVYPERVAFQREERHRAMYEAYFQCPVEFGANHDLLLFNQETMLQPFSTANPELLALLEPHLETELRDHRVYEGYIDQVKRLLRSRMAGQPPTTQDVARELHMSTRTLQRQLANEGVQFQQLLEAVRHELAKEHLRASVLELNEIAFLLGYQEASSFHRAFHHWEGLPPGQGRMAQR